MYPFRDTASHEKVQRARWGGSRSAEFIPLCCGPRLGRRRRPWWRRVALGAVPRGKPEVALLELGERGISGYRGSRRAGGQNRRGDAHAGNGGEDSKFGCRFHSSFVFVRGGSPQ